MKATLGLLPTNPKKVQHTKFFFYDIIMNDGPLLKVLLHGYTLVMKLAFIELPMMGTESHEVVEVMFDYLWSESGVHNLINENTEDGVEKDLFWRNQLYFLTNFIVRNASTNPNPRPKRNEEPYEYNSRRAFFLFQYREALWKSLQELIFRVVWGFLTSPLYSEEEKRSMFDFSKQFGRSKSIERYSRGSIDDSCEDVDILGTIFSPLDSFDVGELDVCFVNILEKEFCDVVQDQLNVTDPLAKIDTWVVSGN